MKRTLIFLHIPKAAGTTFYSILDKNFDSRTIITLKLSKAKEQLNSLPPAKRAKLQVIRGHLRYGIHECLSQPFEYITILRQPIERAISNYYHVLRKPNHRLHDWVTSGKIGLNQYARIRAVCNAQVRLISGCYVHRSPEGCNRDCLERAKHNLEHHFSVIGLAERFDETVLLMARHFGWKQTHYIRQNMTPARPDQDELEADVLDAIKETNALDLELYAFAQCLFEDTLRRQAGLFFKWRLARHRAHCAA